MSKFAAPGPPPRPGLVWNDTTHRWRNPHSGEEHEHPHPEHAGMPPASESLDGLDAKLPDDAKRGTAWQLVKATAQVTHEAVYGWLVRLTPTVMAVMPEVLDTPDDFKKIGFNPAMAGVGPRVHDPISNATGIISTHVAATIASHVMAKAFVWARKKLAEKMAGKSNMADESGTAPENIDQAAIFLSVLYNRISHATGLAINTEPNAIATAIRSGRATAPTKMDDTRALPAVASEPNFAQVGETAVAGRDGQEFARLITEAKDAGSELLWSLVREGVASYRGTGPILDARAVQKVADSLAAVRATADLLGRARTREVAERALGAGGLSKFADDAALSTFAETPPGVIASPEAAVDYFTSLVPSLGIDVGRYPGEQRRTAFTLAVATNEKLTAAVQAEIAKALRENKSVADATAKIRQAISAAGEKPRHGQYAEMVYRTNANDAYQTGLWEEGRHEDVRDVFPVWKYLGIRDGRQGLDHEVKFDKFYPAVATFAEVRGNRPFNCRCSMGWVDFMDWEDLQSRGAREESRW